MLHNYDIVALQEHWLVHNNLYEITEFDANYDGVAVSAMNDLNYIKGPGRPYGGVSIMWKKSLFTNAKILVKDKEGRYVAVKLKACQFECVVINVYLPCFTIDLDYSAELERIFGNIHVMLEQNVVGGQHLFVMGDFNCSFDDIRVKDQLNALKVFVNDWNLESCHMSDPICDNSTYRNLALGHKSTIDHVLCDVETKHLLVNCCVLSVESNLSDHCPVSVCFDMHQSITENVGDKTCPKLRAVKYIWSQDNISIYQMRTFNSGNYMVSYVNVQKLLSSRIDHANVVN